MARRPQLSMRNRFLSIRFIVITLAAYFISFPCECLTFLSEISTRSTRINSSNWIVLQQNRHHDYQRQQQQLPHQSRSRNRSIALSMSSIDDSTSTTATTNLTTTSSINKKNKTPIIREYLGKGKNAVVKEGCVIVSPSWEYHHLLMTSVLFVYGIGENELGEMVARCVILDHPTAFTVGEMMSLPSEEESKLNENTMFRGGDMGNDVVMMLHSFEGNYPNKKEPIGGGSGICEGGLEYILQAVHGNSIKDPRQTVKFFFNFLEFTKQQLDDMFDTEDSAGDSWMSLDVEPSFILNNNYENKGDAWKLLRNTLLKHEQQQEEEAEKP